MQIQDGYEYTFQGVPVVFPYNAYDVQKSYMESVIRALQQRTNALLESPTGTGKTLCLLCAALAWQQQQRELLKKSAKREINDSIMAGGGAVKAKLLEMNTQGGGKPPKILYCSRTHSQIQQVVQEMRKTKYNRTSCTLFGSRAQLCVNPRVKRLTGQAQRMACDSEVKSQACSAGLNIEGRKDVLANVADIEDIVRLGTMKKVCPFFSTKALAEDADIVFMPYNYVMEDAQNMESLLNNSVLILDEAHNVENACQDTASFDLSSGHVAMCMKELAMCIESVSKCVKTGNIPHNLEKILEGTSLDQAARTWKITKQLLTMLESRIKDLCDPKKYPQGSTYPCSHAMDVLKELNITQDTCDMIIHALRHAQAYSNAADVGLPLHLQGTSSVLKAICTLFGRPLRVDKEGGGSGGCGGAKGGGCSSRPGEPRCAQDVANDRQRHLEKLDSFKVHYHMHAENGSVAEMPCMSFWCMFAGVVMQRLQAAGVRSILLTSGTLSPLPATAEELCVPMPVRLENPHVVKPSQVFCSVICKGPSSVALNSSYSNRDCVRFKKDMCAAVCAVAQATRGGVLVFFPSHASMKGITDEWRKSGGYRDLESIKPVYIEPRTAQEFQQVIEQFRKKVAAAVEGSGTGAVLMAVCQGRVSEGIDFSDDEGRAVVVAGIPFPPAKDARVLCKKQVLDEKRRTGGGTLTGGAWYTLSAMRVVNQALGRVIRHKDDFGAILLADERFARGDMQKNISYWARQLMTVRSEFGDLQGDLKKFFDDNEKNAPRRPKKKMQSGAVLGEGTVAWEHQAPVADSKRRAFEPPKLAGMTMHAGHSGPPSKAPKKAGMANNGTGALTELEKSMMLPSAKHVYGTGTVEAFGSQQQGAEFQKAGAQAGTQRNLRLEQQRRMQAANNTLHTSIGVSELSADAHEPSGKQVPGKENDKRIQRNVQVLADLRAATTGEEYLKIKAVIQQFVTSKDVDAFAKQLATAVRGSSRGQTAVPALAAIVSRSKRDTFATQLKKYVSLKPAAKEDVSRAQPQPPSKKDDSTAGQPSTKIKHEPQAANKAAYGMKSQVHSSTHRQPKQCTRGTIDDVDELLEVAYETAQASSRPVVASPHQLKSVGGTTGPRKGSVAESQGHNA